MAYANPEERRRMIAGLCSLADFLEGNPVVPAPRWADVMIFPSATPDGEALKEIGNVAALIGVQVDDRTASNGHYTASLNFGPVQYSAEAIPASSRAYHDARASYSANVIVPTRGCDK